MAGSQPLQPELGQRVLLGGVAPATVRYIGAIDGQEGVWMGLEWDDASRGKHDGSHAGRRYFACSRGPTAGSFVRLAKFNDAADLGRSLVAAAAERYSCGPSTSADPPAAQQPAEQLYVSTANDHRVLMELVTKPADKGSAPGSCAGAAAATVACLAGHRISSVGPAAELRAMLPSLTELDLSSNLVASWRFVAELAAALPGLHTLNLSQNRLELPSLEAPAAAAPGAGPGDALPGSLSGLRLAAPSLTSLQTLVLNGCGASWPQAVAVARQLPNLRALHLCGNGLASLQLPLSAACSCSGSGSGGGGAGAGAGGTPGGAPGLLAAAFPSLELLDLEDNALDSWQDVATLAELPRLRSLLLSGNQLTGVEYTGGFTALQALLLGGNRLGGWAAVDQLDCFPALREARLSDNPVTAEAPSAARYQCIARIGRLATLNASAVSAAERWDAELNYLRLVTDELAAAGADAAARAAVLAANPRFQALTQARRAKYGELAPAAPKAASGSALGSSMALVTVCHGGKTLSKKLPVSLTVGKLKLMLERLLRVKAAQQALLLVPPEPSGAQPEDITDEDARDLRYFDVCDGYRRDTGFRLLEVSTADPAARAAALAAAKAAAAAAHAARMEQHEQTIQQFRAVEQRLMT